MHCKQPPLKFNFICLLSSDYKTHKSFIILQAYLQYICTSCDLSHTNTRKSNSGKFQSVNHWNIIHQKNKIWVEISNWLKDSKTTCHTLLHKTLQNDNYKSVAHTNYQPWSKGTTSVDAP
jgi:hypothetical protein